jgi:hypothetical protein
MSSRVLEEIIDTNLFGFSCHLEIRVLGNIYDTLNTAKNLQVPGKLYPGPYNKGIVSSIKIEWAFSRYICFGTVVVLRAKIDI